MFRFLTPIARVATVLAMAVTPMLLVSSSNAGATEFPVTSAGDSGAGTLRDAVAQAAANAGPDTIVVTPGLGTINLASVISYIANGDLTITGNGVTVNGNGSNGVIHATGGTGALAIDGMTITGSNATGTIAGAVVQEATGDFDFSNCTITGNTSNSGVASADVGALVLIGAGDMTVTNCSITNNTLTGLANQDIGPIDCEGGSLTVTKSNISGNTATGGDASVVAGGMDIEGGPVTIVNSSITRNSATGGVRGDTAGAFAAEGGITSITNSTISGNTASAPVGVSNNTTGGVLIFGGAVTTVYVTLTNNTGGQGANLFSDFTWSSFGTVITGGTPNCFFDTGPGSTSQGYNFTDDASCGLLDATDQHTTGADPGLGALGDNGGPGPTQLPTMTSPVFNAIPIASCQADGAAGITTDERGVTRPQFTGCDIGAVELEPAPVPEVVPQPLIVITPTFTG